MKTSKAVELMLEGKILTEGMMNLRIKNGRVEGNAAMNSIDGQGWLPASDFEYDYLTDKSLKVYEPKSAIEQAIERECGSYGQSVSGSLRSSLRYIANIALDEAKKAVSNYGDCGYGCVVSEAHKRIDALKVKE